MINEQIDPPAAAFEILVETHDLDLDRLPYNALTAAATNLSVSLTCNSPIVVYIFYKCSTVKEKRCVNCFDHCFAHLEKFSPGRYIAAVRCGVAFQRRRGE